MRKISVIILLAMIGLFAESAASQTKRKNVRRPVKKTTVKKPIVSARKHDN